MYPYSSAQTITVPGGSASVVELKAPLNGILNTLIIKQRGATDGFTVNVYTDKVAAGGADDLEQSDDIASISTEVFKVMPAITVAGGQAITENFEKRWGYRGNNIKNSKTRTGLWLRIQPGGTGSKVFDIGLCVLQPELS